MRNEKQMNEITSSYNVVVVVRGLLLIVKKHNRIEYIRMEWNGIEA